jgi:hypothetical protein
MTQKIRTIPLIAQTTIVIPETVVKTPSMAFKILQIPSKINAKRLA